MTDLLALLRHQEGDKLYLYDDATGERVVPGYTMVGHPTIGTGFALDTGGLTQDEDDLLLGHRAAKAAAIVAGIFGVNFSDVEPVRFAAFASMAYQLGGEGLLEFAHMLSAAKACDWDRAAAEALDSKWAHQTSERVHEVAEMIRFGKMPAALSKTA